MFTVISYYTKNTGYEIEVEKLIASLVKFNIPYDIECINNLGDWDKNTRYKALLIKKKLEQYDKVVFIDADAVVMQYPILFDQLECDIAVHLRNGTELLSGTLYLQNTSLTKQLVNVWIQKNKTCTAIEQRNLQSVIKTIPGLRLVELPGNYTKIFDTMKNVGEPVIVHNQASRKFRKAVTCK